MQSCARKRRKGAAYHRWEGILRVAYRRISISVFNDRVAPDCRVVSIFLSTQCLRVGACLSCFSKNARNRKNRRSLKHLSVRFTWINQYSLI